MHLLVGHQSFPGDIGHSVSVWARHAWGLHGCACGCGGKLRPIFTTFHPQRIDAAGQDDLFSSPLADASNDHQCEFAA